MPRWGLALALTALWQVACYVVAKRCSGEEIGCHRGLFLIGAAMSTGWIYLDLVFVTVAVLAAQLFTLAIAVLPGARARYLGLVRAFYRHRMRP